MGTKPSLEDVLKYAEPLANKFIKELAGDLPREQKDEIRQEVRLRLVVAYANLDADAGWRAFTYTHTQGAVRDYLKAGAGFQESRWSLTKPELQGSRNAHKISRRVFNSTPDGKDCDVEQTLSLNGIAGVAIDELTPIRWDLVSRMARIDQSIHAMGRHLLGEGIEDMAPTFDKCRSRIGQLIQAFVDRFDDPVWSDSVWFAQMCYAFGLCKALGMPDVDQSTIAGRGSCGWDLEPVDLENLPDIPDEPEQLAMNLE